MLYLMQARLLALRDVRWISAALMARVGKRLPREAAAVLAVLACLWGHGGEAMAASLDDSVRVSVTTKPVHSLVAQVMEGVAVPQLIVDGATSAHTFTLKPSSVRAIASGGVFVRVSEATEPFTHKLVEGLSETVEALTLADEKLGVKLLPQRRGGSFEPHAHDEGASHDAGHDEAETVNGIDGHVWLDPENAKAMVRAVAKTLSEKWPAHAAAFTQNAETSVSRLEALTADISHDVAPVKGRPFIVFHDAYQYFETRFGLAAAGAITLSPDQPPSAKRLAEVRARIQSLGAKCIFSEPGFQPKLLAAVTEGSAVRTANLDPEGQTLEAGPGLYEKLMREMAQSLTACLSGN